jgi:hypothetical protein
MILYDSVIRIAAFIFGGYLVLSTLNAAMVTFLLPRPAAPEITRLVFRLLRRVVNIFCQLAPDYEARDHIMAMYVPLGLVLLVPVMLLVILIGFALMFFATGAGMPFEALTISGSSLLTLGFVTVSSPVHYVLAFAEAAIGIMLSALLISYLPTIYASFQRRELLVTKIETSAGSPPAATTLIERYYLILGRRSPSAMIDAYDTLWTQWIDWFTDIEESHTSLSMVSFLRSQQPNRSWITAAGAILDTAALVRSTVEIPMNTRADLMIRSGYLALKAIAKNYGFRYVNDVTFPKHPISISRAEFDTAYELLSRASVPLRADRDQCWQDFAGWRVNYDAPLLDICALLMAPEAPWSADRCAGRWYLTPTFKDRNLVEDSEASKDANSEDALPDSAVLGR